MCVTYVIKCIMLLVTIVNVIFYVIIIHEGQGGTRGDVVVYNLKMQYNGPRIGCPTAHFWAGQSSFFEKKIPRLAMDTKCPAFAKTS